MAYRSKHRDLNSICFHFNLSKGVDVPFSHSCGGVIFNQRADVGPHAIQSAISATAACVIRFAAGDDSDRDWAWDVMERVMGMAEPEYFYGSKIPWHPVLHLVVALFHDRKSGSPRADSAARLMRLAGYPLDDVQTMAFHDWCQSDAYRPKIQALLAQLAQWTSDRLMPSWHDDKSRRDKETYLFEWDRALGSMMARAAPFLDLEWMRKNLVQPFLVEDEEALRVLAAFAENVVLRHVIDAPSVPLNAFPLLDDCVARVIGDRMFRPKGYRAGEVHGYDMPKLIEALLFVSVEKADGAARFANGDWSNIQIIMPLVTKLVTATGWSTFVMQKFLTLCERAGDAYPLDDFVRQSSAVLNSIDNAKGSWVGTSLPARTAAIIQRLADANYPLKLSQARALLSLLDALIDPWRSAQCSIGAD